MENRRANYRHSFAMQAGVEVELECVLHSLTIFGRLVDLSVGGMKVRLWAPCVRDLANDDWILCASIPDLPGTPVLLSSVVYSWRDGAVGYCGMRFLPLADAKANEARDQLLWRFLLDEQRQPGTRRTQQAPQLLRIYRED